MVSAALFVTFDILTILISFADVVTDIIVLYQWYQSGHMIYFWISLSILILANLSYYIMYLRFVKDTSYNNTCDKSVMLSIFGIPLIPILPYLTYFYETPHMCSSFTLFIRDLFNINSYHLQTQLPEALRQALEDMNEINFDLVFKDILKDKINCHIGFILETFIESFPQSIIQMIAILQLSQTNDTISNIIIVSSIFLSLISIAFKSIMLLAVADLWTSIFNWTATIIDFFAVFVITSWLFLEIDGNQDGFTSTLNLQHFIAGLAVFTTVPFVTAFLGYLIFATLFESEDFNQVYSDIIAQCCAYSGWCCSFVCVFIGFLIILPFGIAAGHILCVVFVGMSCLQSISDNLTL